MRLKRQCPLSGAPYRTGIYYIPRVTSKHLVCVSSFSVEALSCEQAFKQEHTHRTCYACGCNSVDVPGARLYIAVCAYVQFLRLKVCAGLCASHFCYLITQYTKVTRMRHTKETSTIQTSPRYEKRGRSTFKVNPR